LDELVQPRRVRSTPAAAGAQCVDNVRGEWYKAAGLNQFVRRTEEAAWQQRR
jgi:hypothetical protein